MDWVAIQDIAVTVDDKQMTILGSNVRQPRKPDYPGDYGWDKFILERDGKAWRSGVGGGEYEGAGIVTIEKKSSSDYESLENYHPMRSGFYRCAGALTFWPGILCQGEGCTLMSMVKYGL